MGLEQFERRLERLVEGIFAKAFRSGLQPVEIGRRLTREMDLHRTVAPKGTLAPNDFTVALSPGDHDRFAPIEDELISELTSVAKDHAHSEGYIFVGPVRVSLRADPDLQQGMLLVAGEMAKPPPPRPAPAPAPAGAPAAAPAAPSPGLASVARPPAVSPRRAAAPVDSHAATTAIGGGRAEGGWFAEATLLLPDGRRLALGSRLFTIGRLPECELVLGDPNVSRRHAEIRPIPGGYELADLGSTNGTRVNGVPLAGPRALHPGDEITFGATTVRFESS